MNREYNPITKEELKAKLQSHSCWLQDKATGERLDLSMYDLSNMDLRGRICWKLSRRMPVLMGPTCRGR